MNRQLILFSIFVLLLANLLYSFYLGREMKRTVVIDVIKVFNEFNFKKDLEQRVTVPLSRYSSRIDSLTAFLSNAEQRGDSGRILQLRDNIYYLQQEAQQVLETSNKSINEQVWKRLNPLIDEFGEKHDLKIIIGANGMGSVLYKDDAVDKTRELIEYVNEKYEKGS